MAREVESGECSAMVMMGIAQSGSILSCRSWGEGECLKDRRREAEIPNVSVVVGACLADEIDGVVDSATPTELIADIRAQGSMPATNALLDDLLSEEDN
jgi:hypothetical protein